MTRVLLIISCAPGDADAVVEVLRAGTTAPIHVTVEGVYGRDFSDACAAEQVGGMLDRRALSLVADPAQIDGLIHRAVSARRRQPVRWRLLPLLSEGRAP